jgi:hypothetical protein
MDQSGYEICIESLQNLLEFTFRQRWELSDGKTDPLEVILGQTGSSDVIGFGDAAASFVSQSIGLVETNQLSDHVRHIDNVLKLGTFLSMRSTESSSLLSLQQSAPIIGPSLGDYSHDPRTQRMVVLCSCWIALYFLGMRFDFLLAAVKRLGERSQGYPNGFVSIVFLAECIEDYRYDVTTQESTGDIYFVAASNPRLFVSWDKQILVQKRTAFSWEEVIRPKDRDWTRFTEYIGWFYYYWQCLLLGSAFQNTLASSSGETEPRIRYCLDLNGILPDEENIRLRTPAIRMTRDQSGDRLERFFGKRNVMLVPLDQGYSVGAYHSRGGFTIGTREGFGSSYDIVARRLEGTLLTEHLNRLKNLISRSDNLESSNLADTPSNSDKA